MSKSHGASSVIPDPMPNKSAPLRLVPNPELEVPSFAYDDVIDADERTIVSAISRDMLGLTDDHGAATKTYEVPRELLELARARAMAQRASSRPPGAAEPQEFSLSAPLIPTGLEPEVGLVAGEEPNTLPPELEAYAGTESSAAPADTDAETSDAPLAKPRRKFAVTKWVVLAGVYVAICYFARIWLPLP